MSFSEKLFKRIEHGDAEHRAWLKKELEAFFSEEPLRDCGHKDEGCIECCEEAAHAAAKKLGWGNTDVQQANAPDK